MLNSLNILEHCTHIIIHEMFMNIHKVRFKLTYYKSPNDLKLTLKINTILERPSQ